MHNIHSSKGIQKHSTVSKRFGAIFPANWSFNDLMKDADITPSTERHGSVSPIFTFAQQPSLTSPRPSTSSTRPCPDPKCENCASRVRFDSGVFPCSTGSPCSRGQSAATSNGLLASNFLYRWPLIADDDIADSRDSSSKCDVFGPLGALESELHSASNELKSTGGLAAPSSPMNPMPSPSHLSVPVFLRTSSRSKSPTSPNETSHEVYSPSSLRFRHRTRIADPLNMLRKKGIKGIWSATVHNAPMDEIVRTGRQRKRRPRLEIRPPVAPMKATAFARKKTSANPATVSKA